MARMKTYFSERDPCCLECGDDIEPTHTDYYGPVYPDECPTCGEDGNLSFGIHTEREDFYADL